MIIGCKFRHIKDENFIPRDNKENKNNNGADKKKVTPKIPNRKFTFANNLKVLICIVEYDGACPSSDFPLGGPTRRLL